MAKVIGPLQSLDARGQFGKSMVFSAWKGINTVRQYVIPTYRNTTEQANIRKIVSDASVAWKISDTIGGVEIDAAYKLAYDSAAQGSQYSGFNLFMKECIAKNGGVAYDGSLEIPTAPGDIA